MKIIVGLGNPGKEYENTRHNAGFDAIDLVAREMNVSFTQEKFNATLASFNYQQEKIILVKPLTYMNNSGIAVRAIVDFYKLDLNDLLIVHDDLDLAINRIRIRKKGSAGGQKGMASIQSHLNTQEINRIRIGIDKNPLIPIVDYVLGRVAKEDRDKYQNSLQHTSDAIIYFFKHPIDEVMNRFNL
ncbi:MAG: aminoacyl-tRNA hydrolase [Anaerorhabdus sp.]